MSAVFLKLLNMSITAGWLILAILAARLLLKKAPRWVSCLLWALAGLRLLLPVSLKSVLSLIPSAETIPANIARSPHPTIQSGISALNRAVNPLMERAFAPGPLPQSGNPLQLWLPLAAAVWLLGLAALLLYALVSFLKLRRTVAASVRLAERVYACDEIKTPFILGVLRPTIYVPSSMREETLSYVLRHEAAHLRRRDHWWKPLGYLLLSVYWFNPLCWLAYLLLCRDIEAACDEKVIRDMDRERVAAYSQALLDCSLPRRRVAACPLAFGETGVKQRIKGILNYKKPAFWLILLAVLVCAVLAVCLLTDPRPDAQPSDGTAQWFDYRHEEVGWDVIDSQKETSPDAWPGVVFQCDSETMTAVTAQGSEQLYTGMPIWSVYFCDLTGDGKPELCSTVSFGSGLVDDRIIVYDYERGKRYELSDRGEFDYTLRLQNGALVVEKRVCNSETLLGTGKLWIDGDSLRFLPEGVEEASVAVFTATILELGDGSMLVCPTEGSPESRSAGKIWVPVRDLSPYVALQVGDLVEIEYNGEIMETYPGRLREMYAIRSVSESAAATETEAVTEPETAHSTVKDAGNPPSLRLELTIDNGQWTIVGVAARRLKKAPCGARTALSRPI